MNLKIQIVSDLHIEQTDDLDIKIDYYIKPVGDILILAGDIGSLYKYEQLCNFLTSVCGKFKHVVYVPGNCEYYYISEDNRMKMSDLKKSFADLTTKLTNLTILDRGLIQIGDVIIAGCTLWSDAKINIPKYIVKIHKISSTFYKFMFDRDIQFIKEVISHTKKNKCKLIMVTHYAPHPQFVETKRPKFASLYGTDLSELFDECITHWIFGHTHKNIDVNINSINFVTNQFGKKKMEPGFILDKCIQL